MTYEHSTEKDGSRLRQLSVVPSVRSKAQGSSGWLEVSAGAGTSATWPGHLFANMAASQ